MIIKDFRVYHISKKLNPALPNAVYSLEYIEHVFLELDTDMYTGVGMAYTFNTVQAEAMKLLVEGYCRNLIGKDPSLIRAHWQAAHGRLRADRSAHVRLRGGGYRPVGSGGPGGGKTPL